MIQKPFSFIPGPKSIDYIGNSQDFQEIAEYPVFDVLNYFCEMDNIKIIKNGGKDPYKWLLKWEKEIQNMLINFTTFDGENFSCWGGSTIQPYCSKKDIIDLWLQIRERFKEVWIHDDDCNIYSIEAFEKEF